LWSVATATARRDIGPRGQLKRDTHLYLMPFFGVWFSASASFLFVTRNSV
jgi:hypothetical protein